MGFLSKDKDKVLFSFWILLLMFEVKVIKLEKLFCMVICFMLGKFLCLLDLMFVYFILFDSFVDCVGFIMCSECYVCVVICDSLSNVIFCVVLWFFGVVVIFECVEKLIWKDMVDFVIGDKFIDCDIIVL